MSLGVTAVIVTRNRLEFTRHCLDSLVASSDIDEWIVVDDGSSDGSTEWLLDWSGRTRGASVIVHPRPLGPCRARNRGLAVATQPLVLFADNDVFASEAGWLARLKVAFEQGDQSRLAAVAPLLLFPGDLDIIQSAGGGVSTEGHVGLLGRGESFDSSWAISEELAWAPTAALLVDRRAALGVGGFDVAFDPVSSCEDIDFCCRLRQQGWRLERSSDATLRHFEGVTTKHRGFDERPYWLRNITAIKNRWRSILAAGPLHASTAFSWKTVQKDYRRLDSASVRVVDAKDPQARSLSFFDPYLGQSDGEVPAVRIAVVGCGQVSLRGALPGFSAPDSRAASLAASFLRFNGAENARVIAVCDVDAQMAERAASVFLVQDVFVDYTKLLDVTPIDAVCICSPPAAHTTQVLAAIKRKLPVLVEKPPAVSLVDLEELLADVSRRAGSLVMVNLPWLFHPAVECAAALVTDGRLGALRTARISFKHSGPELWAPEAKWYRLGGLATIVNDLGLHALTVLEAVTRDKCADLSVVRGHPDGLDSVAIVHSGSVACSVEVGWNSERPVFEVYLVGDRAEMHLRLLPWTTAGVRESLRMRSLLPQNSTTEDPCIPANWVSIPVDDSPICGGPYRHFVDTVRHGGYSRTDLMVVANAARLNLAWASQCESSVD